MILIAGIVIVLLLGLGECNRNTGEPIIEHYVIHDTIEIPVEVIRENTKIKNVYTIDTVYVHNQDTIYIKDIPIEEKEVNVQVDNDSTKANIYVAWHGFASDIDSIGLDWQYTKERETIIKKAKPYGLDVTVGPSIFYGVNPQGQLNFGAGISVTLGFGYRITK